MIVTVGDRSVAEALRQAGAELKKQGRTYKAEDIGKTAAVIVGAMIVELDRLAENG